MNALQGALMDSALHAVSEFKEVTNDAIHTTLKLSPRVKRAELTSSALFLSPSIPYPRHKMNQ
jgi:hypothetical protein